MNLVNILLEYENNHIKENPTTQEDIEKTLFYLNTSILWDNTYLFQISYDIIQNIPYINDAYTPEGREYADDFNLCVNYTNGEYYCYTSDKDGESVDIELDISKSDIDILIENIKQWIKLRDRLKEQIN